MYILELKHIMPVDKVFYKMETKYNFLFSSFIFLFVANVATHKTNTKF